MLRLLVRGSCSLHACAAELTGLLTMYASVMERAKSELDG